MNFISTRNNSPAATLSQAIAAAPRTRMAAFMYRNVAGLAAPGARRRFRPTPPRNSSLPFHGDAFSGRTACRCAGKPFDFPARYLRWRQRTIMCSSCSMDLLRHSRIWRALPRRLRDPAAQAGGSSVAVVATSGDTGAAVAVRPQPPRLRVVMLYPDGRVSPRFRRVNWAASGDNIRALRVAGSSTIARPWSSARSTTQRCRRGCETELGQQRGVRAACCRRMAVVTHSAALAHKRATGETLNFVIPTGNLGNAMAAIIARALGARWAASCWRPMPTTCCPPISSPARTIPPVASVATIANAMDVGAPSNFERLRWVLPGRR